VRATLARLLAYVGVLALIAIGVIEAIPLPSGNKAEDTRPAPARVEVDRARPAFTLADATDARYSARRHAAGGGRQDIMSFGPSDRSAPFGQVEIYRPGAELAAFGDAVAEIAVRTADLDLAANPSPAEVIDTKFGRVPLIDFALNAQDAPRRCLGFVRRFEEPLLEITGWTCNAGPEMVDRGALACLIDRLAVLADGRDGKIAGLFAAAELKRSFCGQKSPILAATQRRIDWIDAAKDVKLRGRLAGR